MRAAQLAFNTTAVSNQPIRPCRCRRSAFGHGRVVRIGSGRGGPGNPEAVPETSLGLQREALRKLGPESTDVQVDRAPATAVALPPHLAHQLFARKQNAAMTAEAGQK